MRIWTVVVGIMLMSSNCLVAYIYISLFCISNTHTTWLSQSKYWRLFTIRENWCNLRFMKFSSHDFISWSTLFTQFHLPVIESDVGQKYRQFYLSNIFSILQSSIVQYFDSNRSRRLACGCHTKGSCCRNKLCGVVWTRCMD